MRRFLSWLMLSVFIALPILTSCVPGGYEGDNPNRPEEFQVEVEETEGDTEAPIEEETE